jgi:hypothetical protein
MEIEYLFLRVGNKHDRESLTSLVDHGFDKIDCSGKNEPEDLYDCFNNPYFVLLVAIHRAHLQLLTIVSEYIFEWAKVAQIKLIVKYNVDAIEFFVLEWLN